MTAYRAYPGLLSTSAAHNSFRSVVEEALVLGNDRGFAQGIGVWSQIRASSGRSLSKRESEVLALVAAGLSNAEIASRLFISNATVKVHVRHIFEKLGVRSRTQAALHPVARHAYYATPDMLAHTSPSMPSRSQEL